MDFVQAAGIQQGGMSLPVLVPRKRKLASKITCKTKLFRELVKTTLLYSNRTHQTTKWLVVSACTPLA